MVAVDVAYMYPWSVSWSVEWCYCVCSWTYCPVTSSGSAASVAMSVSCWSTGDSGGDSLDASGEGSSTSGRAVSRCLVEHSSPDIRE